MVKRIYLYVFVVSVVISFNFFLNNKIDSLKNDTKILYKYFEKNHLVDVSGNVKLDEVVSIKNEKEKSIKKLYNVEKVDSIEFDKILADRKSANEKLNNDIIDATRKSDALDSDINNLASQYKVVKKKYDSYIYSISSKTILDGSSVLLSNVPTINQYPTYNTGCESVALAILLRANGVSVTPDQVISNLSKTGLPYNENGVIYGGNPEVEFVGNPYGNGYGVFQNPIANVASKFKGNVHVKTNFSLSDVLKLVKDGHPVQVWSSINLAAPYISTSWIYKPTGEKISWHAYEHAVVVVGYNDNSIIISDPIGGAIKYQPRSTFEARYNYFGKRAVYYS